MAPKTRNTLQYIFFGSLIILLLYLLISFSINQDYNSIIGIASILIAVFSLIVTTVSVNQFNDSKLPQIIVDFDFEARYSLVLLKIINLGEMTAYDIRIKWDKPLLNRKGENIATLGGIKNTIQIPVLQYNQNLFFTIDSTSKFFEENSDDQLRFSGEIEFSLRKSKKRKIKQKFYIDAVPYRKTLLYGNENFKTEFELQKIPKQLESIANELKNLQQLKSNEV